MVEVMKPKENGLEPRLRNPSSNHNKVEDCSLHWNQGHPNKPHKESHLHIQLKCNRIQAVLPEMKCEDEIRLETYTLAVFWL